jgi:hypothetical protein
MPSITSWTRLEPRTRSATMSTGLQARIHDPLWLLARQWQLGEFDGEDVASPAKAELEIEQSQLERYCPGAPDANRAGQFNSKVPLETLVERESILRASKVNARLTAEAGLQLFRLLGTSLTAKYRTDFLEEYALDQPDHDQDLLDSASLRFIGVLAGRVVDGAKLYHDLAPLRRSGQPLVLPSEEPFSKIDGNDLPAVRQGIERWLTWYDGLFSEPNEDSSWTPEQMEYTFAVSAPNKDSPGAPDELVLVASEYYEGHLDWYSFDVDREPQHELEVTQQSHKLDPVTFIPSPLRFRGMPVSRWWEFEDADVDFGGVETAPEDLARLLLMEFALIYGNDFFVVPVDLSVGSICWVNSLVVTDTYGDLTTIKPASEVDLGNSGAAPWRMFSLSKHNEHVSNPQPPPEFLFLPPVLGWNLQSTPIEEVLLLRDEMANLAWAVERTVENPMGQPLNRFEAYQRERQLKEQEDPDSTIPRSGPLTYRIASSVPPYWVPLIPEHTGSTKRDIVLRLSGVPLGQILSVPNQILRVNEEEVPREGAHITRTYQYARWTDGSSHVWMGRRKETGRGEGLSGLRFDVIEQT